MTNLYKLIQASKADTYSAKERIKRSRHLLKTAVRREISSPLVLASAFGVGLAAGRKEKPTSSKKAIHNLPWLAATRHAVTLLLNVLPLGLGGLVSSLLIR